MPIYDIFDTKEEFQAPPEEKEARQVPYTKKDRFFSSLTARVLFFILFLADIVWMAYAASLVVLCGFFSLVSWFRWPLANYVMRKQWIALKRSSVCGLSLLISLFSPALGIMVACTYFLMYDKNGIQEVVPASLQEQFQEFLR